MTSEKKEYDSQKTLQHPLFGISFKNWIQLLEKNGGIDKPFLGRAAFITLGSMFTAFSRLLYNIQYKPKIESYTIKKSPVIIIGHWRSGTTFLHELLSSDPQFCYVSLWDTMLPNSFPLFEPWKQFLSRFLPQTRPMDNIEVDINGPYEEEAGIAVLSPWSFFHALHFPKNADEQYFKSVHFKGLNDKEKKKWEHMYENFMKTVVYRNKGKRLLLKDPANTARIPLLLHLFPNAKFIHIYRNPYKVYMSTVKMRNKVLTKLALQHGNSNKIEREVIEYYKRLMKEFFKQKELISKDRLIEIRFEDFVKNPMSHVKRIYSHLELSGLQHAIPYMKRYLDSKKDYKKNVYTINDKIIQRVRNEWNFTIDQWGYKPP